MNPPAAAGPDADLVALHSPWSVARISLFGGQLLSFVPTGGEDLLWMSPAPLPRPAPIRGGVPLCWPWFARQNMPASAAQHGLARISRWRIVGRDRLADGRERMALAPQESLDPMQVSLTVTVGHTLQMVLTTRNNDVRPRLLTQAFHSYLRVADVGQVAIDGLDGVPFLDSLDNGQAGRQSGALAPTACDRIYHGLPDGSPVTVRDPVAGRSITVTGQGSGSVVVWNPGPVLAARMADLPGDAWRGFVCVEVANAGPDARTLAPGQSQVLGQSLAWSAHS